MSAQELLQEIAEYCRHSGLAESTFGRRAVNDGKLTARLRNGGRITTETLDRIRGFMQSNRMAAPLARPTIIARTREPHPATLPEPVLPAGTIRSATSASSTTGRSICCSSIPAAKNGWSPAGSDSSWPMSIRARRHCACSTPAWATAPCCCG